MSSSSSSTAAAPSWSNTTTSSNRITAIEDHNHSSSSSTTTTGMDELLAPVSTLDEPVMETIMRDVRAVGVKLKAVLIPLDRNVSLFLVSTQIIYCNKHLPYFFLTTETI